MGKVVNQNTIAAARVLFNNDLSLSDISTVLNVSLSTLERYSAKENWVSNRSQLQAALILSREHQINISVKTIRHISEEIDRLVAEGKAIPPSYTDQALKAKQMLERNKTTPDEVIAIVTELLDYISTHNNSKAKEMKGIFNDFIAKKIQEA